MQRCKYYQKRRIMEAVGIVVMLFIFLTTVAGFGSYKDVYGSESKITVTFALRNHNTYWINKHTVEVSKDAYVVDVIEQELKKAKLTYGIRDNRGYLYKVNGLEEFDKGVNSGWMYTVNGNITQLGINQYKLKNSDSIKVFYTIDWTEEKGVDAFINNGNTESSNSKTSESTSSGQSKSTNSGSEKNTNRNSNLGTASQKPSSKNKSITTKKSVKTEKDKNKKDKDSDKNSNIKDIKKDEKEKDDSGDKITDDKRTAKTTHSKEIQKDAEEKNSSSEVKNKHDYLIWLPIGIVIIVLGALIYKKIYKK